MGFKVIQSGGLATVQDLGRFGYQRFGIPPAGAMDSYALCAANLLVGNAPGAAAVEVGLAGLTLAATTASLVALTGAGFALRLQGRTMPPWTALFVQQGWAVELEPTGAGGWAYLAVAGGLQGPALLGSRATYLRGQWDHPAGRALQPGEVLPAGAPARPLLPLAGRTLPAAHRPRYTQTPILEVVLGPQAEAFTEAGLQTFLTTAYLVSATSDRMGYRLEGAPLARQDSTDLISDGLALGSIQVPPNGQPIILMSDRPTTGGYPKIATVVSADLPALAQCAPGAGRVRFRPTTVEAAQARYRHEWRAFAENIQAPEPPDAFG